MPLNIDTLITGHNINTILRFTREREAENIAHGLRRIPLINLEKSSDLYVKLKKLDIASKQTQELDSLINQCIEIIEESTTLSDEQKLLLLTEIKKDHGVDNRSSGAVIAVFCVFISIYAIIPAFLIDHPNTNYKDPKVLFSVFAILFLDVTLACWAMAECIKGHQNTANNEEYFMKWASDVAQEMNEIDATLSLSVAEIPIATTYVDEDRLEMQPIQSSLQALAMPKTGYSPVPSRM